MIHKIRTIIEIINLVLEKDENLTIESKKSLIRAREELYQLMDDLLQVKGISRELMKISKDLSKHIGLNFKQTTAPSLTLNILELLNESVYVECIINPNNPEKVTITKAIPKYYTREVEPFSSQGS